MKKTTTIIFLIITGFALLASPVQSQNAKKEVLKCVDQMEEHWNSGDQEAYMGYYWKSDSLTMQSSMQRFYGWDTIYALFVDMFNDENLRGVLEFSEIEVPAFSDDLALVTGKFHLVYPDGQSREGYFTVLYKKFPDGWKIIHDQS